MKRHWFAVLLLCISPVPLAAQVGIYQRGTVMRMRMVECLAPERPLMATLSGASIAPGQELCPEYTLVAEKVVFKIVGKTSNQLIPLAEDIEFRFKGNGLAVRIDDEKHETHFRIREMEMRSDWDREQQRVVEEIKMLARQPLDTGLPVLNSR